MIRELFSIRDYRLSNGGCKVRAEITEVYDDHDNEMSALFNGIKKLRTTN